jgi:MMP 1-O-methyltransferase
LKTLFKSAIKRSIQNLGYEVTARNTDHLEKVNDGVSTYAPEFSLNFSKVPGMIGVERALNFYFIAYSQKLSGNIVEIGSWQGRSTCFFAQACKDSNNGMVFAIDPFSGNPGKEDLYVVGKKDLSDLKENFITNIEINNLNDYIKVFPMISTEARSLINEEIRLLFIDGNHDYEFVKEDIKNFTPLLKSGGIVIFDDYNVSNFPGVVRAVKELVIESNRFCNFIQLKDTFIATRK